jgi:hypothetical protein
MVSIHMALPKVCFFLPGQRSAPTASSRILALDNAQSVGCGLKSLMRCNALSLNRKLPMLDRATGGVSI